jgi:hypothetical protein
MAMGTGIFWLVGAVCLATFGVLLRFAVQALEDRKYRTSAAWFFWSFVPLGIACAVLVARGEPDVSDLTRNVVLGFVGAVMGASLAIWGGYAWWGTAANAQSAEKGPTMAQGPSINTWNQSGGTNTINLGLQPRQLSSDLATKIASALRSANVTSKVAVETDLMACPDCDSFARQFEAVIGSVPGWTVKSIRNGLSDYGFRGVALRVRDVNNPPSGAKALVSAVATAGGNLTLIGPRGLMTVPDGADFSLIIAQPNVQ